MRNGILFFGFALVTFWFAFGPIGGWLCETWSALFIWWKPPGLIGALWTVICMLLGLLPQLVILFSFFYFVEKYSSPSLIRIVMGFGCGTVAASTLSLVRDAQMRRREALFLSFIPCSAQMPVVLMLAGIVGLSFFEIFLLYAGTVGIGWLIAHPRFYKKRRYNDICDACDAVKSAASGKKGFLPCVLENIFQFFQRISGTVLIAAGVLYYLSHFGILEIICGLAEPLFIPLGFSSDVITVLIFGLLGKEMAAAAIVMLSPFITAAEILTFLVFFMLYPPCIANIKAIAVKAGRRTAAEIVVLKFFIAYFVAFVFFVAYILLFC